MRLAMSMGRTLHELYSSISSEELTLWGAYAELYGLDAQRHEAATALAGYYCTSAMGGKVKLSQFVPRFGADHCHEVPHTAGVNAVIAAAEAHNAKVKAAR